MADVQKALARAEELSKAAAQIAGYGQSPKHSQLKTEAQAVEPSDRSAPVDQVAGSHVAGGNGKKKKGKKDEAEKGRAAQIADLAKAAAALAETDETETETETDAAPDGGEETETDAAPDGSGGEAETAPDDDGEVERSLRGHPDVQKTVDVSGWVRGITDQLDAALNTFDATLAKSVEAGAIQTQAIAALAQQIAEENAELREIVKGQGERIDRLERTPLDRKGITKSGAPGIQTPAAGDGVSKGEVLARMSALAEKGLLSPMDVAMFEGSGQFSIRARELIARGQ